MIHAPCLDCPDRKVTADYNCHSECKAYLDYSANRKEVYDAKRYSYIPYEITSQIRAKDKLAR